jgi:hypothetical protein
MVADQRELREMVHESVRAIAGDYHRESWRREGDQ